jgi:hypothetical protein
VGRSAAQQRVTRAQWYLRVYGGLSASDVAAISVPDQWGVSVITTGLAYRVTDICKKVPTASSSPLGLQWCPLGATTWYSGPSWPATAPHADQAQHARVLPVNPQSAVAPDPDHTRCPHGAPELPLAQCPLSLARRSVASTMRELQSGSARITLQNRHGHALAVGSLSWFIGWLIINNPSLTLPTFRMPKGQALTHGNSTRRWRLLEVRRTRPPIVPHSSSGPISAPAFDYAGIKPISAKGQALMQEHSLRRWRLRSARPPEPSWYSSTTIGASFRPAKQSGEIRSSAHTEPGTPGTVAFALGSVIPEPHHRPHSSATHRWQHPMPSHHHIRWHIIIRQHPGPMDHSRYSWSPIMPMGSIMPWTASCLPLVHQPHPP